MRTKRFLSALFFAIMLTAALTSSLTADLSAASEYIRGDLNGDGEIDRNDAIYCLYYSIFGEEQYSVEQSCDFQGDGTVDRNDAIYLLYHSLFGEADYPLASDSGASEKIVLTSNKIGEINGHSYELWKDRGDTTMTLAGDGTFSCEWKNINNALFRIGKKFDCTKTYREIGNIQVDYKIDYQPDGNSYFCVYGWTREPLVEYYVVESWGNWRPPGGDPLATITVDGAKYDVYKTIRVNQPSIDGNTTFVQYWSVRQEKSTEGSVNLGTHFAAWEALGMPMGKMYEAALTVEGYQSQGKANVLKNKLTIGGEITEPDPSELPKPIEPDENGNYLYATYESGKDGWGSRGSSKVATTDAAASKGSRSLAVTGRADAWNGAQLTLSTSDFKPGSAYSFSVDAMQNKTESIDFKLTLQYIGSDGQTHYDCIAEISGASGEWITLTNTAYTIPEGAWDLLLYVETSSGTVDFYIDEAIIAIPK